MEKSISCMYVSNVTSNLFSEESLLYHNGILLYYYIILLYCMCATVLDKYSKLQLPIFYIHRFKYRIYYTFNDSRVLKYKKIYRLYFVVRQERIYRRI